LIVVAFHIDLITRDTNIWDPQASTHGLLTSLVLSGGSGVTLFFVLSGFLLFLPYARALLFVEAWPSTRQFYARRALRIIPAYYITLLLLLIFPVLQPQILRNMSLPDIVIFLTFLMDSVQETVQKINGPFWTLAVEWQFYMLLPLMVLGMRLAVRRCISPQRRLRVVVGCLLLLMAWGIFWRAWGNTFAGTNPTPGVQSVLYFLFYGSNGKYLEDFAVGMLVCLIYVYAQRAGRERLVRWLETKSFWLWGSGIVLLFYVATSWPLSIFGPQFVYNAISELLFSCGYGLCILAILFNTRILSRLFSWQPLCALGKISYSLYMWHLPLLIILMVNIQQRFSGGNSLAIYALYWCYVGLVIIPFSANFYRWFEQPGIALAARIKKKRTVPVAPKFRPSVLEKQEIFSGQELLPREKVSR